jgi:hypothetical protein
LGNLLKTATRLDRDILHIRIGALLLRELETGGAET